MHPRLLSRLHYAERTSKVGPNVYNIHIKVSEMSKLMLVRIGLLGYVKAVGSKCMVGGVHVQVWG
jgi:hypothetical protein